MMIYNASISSKERGRTEYDGKWRDDRNWQLAALAYGEYVF